MNTRYAIGKLPEWNSEWNQIIKDLAKSFEEAAGKGTTYWDQRNRILYVIRCPSYRQHIYKSNHRAAPPVFYHDAFEFDDIQADRLLSCTRGWYSNGAYMTSLNFLGTKTLEHKNLPYKKIFPDQLDKLIRENINISEMYATVKATQDIYKRLPQDYWLKKQKTPVTDPFFGTFDSTWGDVQFSEFSPQEQAVLDAHERYKLDKAKERNKKRAYGRNDSESFNRYDGNPYRNGHYVCKWDTRNRCEVILGMNDGMFPGLEWI